MTWSHIRLSQADLPYQRTLSSCTTAPCCTSRKPFDRADDMGQILSYALSYRWTILDPLSMSFRLSVHPRLEEMISTVHDCNAQADNSLHAEWISLHLAAWLTHSYTNPDIIQAVGPPLSAITPCFPTAKAQPNQPCHWEA